MKCSHGLLKNVIPKEIIKKISKSCYFFLKKRNKVENYYGNIDKEIPPSNPIIKNIFLLIRLFNKSLRSISSLLL